MLCLLSRIRPLGGARLEASVLLRRAIPTGGELDTNIPPYGIESGFIGMPTQRITAPPGKFAAVRFAIVFRAT